ncbi:hypothetical protein CHS0354_037947 [Potamilus streckersoni]|uniref:NAD(P)H oxidase (H2O2-forming) n=1 Tax=Potamilus streckersoni TaxID=2493646 RepID=A0AAE0W9D8_9BIVA|nr:hypothetical protein CHS0354_037947 [Potamilus streckersoni]
MCNIRFHCLASTALLVVVSTANSEKEFEVTPQDGWFNNLIHPDWGAIDGHLLRRSPAAFSDGVYEPSGKDRPNPFIISKEVHDGPAGLGSLRNRTAFLVYFGQQVVEEILDAQRPGCPREFFNIPVPPGHDYDLERKGNIEMPVQRTRYDQRTGISPNNPRQQLNEITPYIDGGLTYGTSKAWTDALREFKDGPLRGRLAALDPYADIKDSFPAQNSIRLPMANPPPPREHELKPVKRFWKLGNPRGNENPFLLTFGVLWFRWHNYIANKTATEHPKYTDEEVFNIARKFVIAHHQKIVMYNWLPTWLGLDENLEKIHEIPPYKKRPNDTIIFDSYDPNVHPGIAAEFQSAAMRFGHTLVTPGTWIRDKKCEFKKLKLDIPGSPSNVHALRLCNSFWNPQEFLSKPNALDELIMGLTSTLSEREDHIVVPDLRKHLFGPLEFSRRDLIAINIQRARDHGLPDYNTIREAYGLPRRQAWEEINNFTFSNGTLYMKEPINNLRRVYGNTSKPDNVDLFPAGLLETTPEGVGETFRTIILDQFLRIRHSDRFWFENTKNGLFTEDEIQEIWNVTIYDIVTKVTHIGPDDIQRNPFLLTDSPCPQPKQLVADGNDTFNDTDNTLVIEQCTPLKHFDYFAGSHVSFVLTFLCLGLCVPIAFGVLVFLAKYREKSKRQTSIQNETRKEDPGTFLMAEWTSPKDGERKVKTIFDLARMKIHIMDRHKRPLRMIDLRRTTGKVHVRISDDKNRTLISIRVPGEIDLVLRFVDEGYRDEFLNELEKFLQNISVDIERHFFSEAIILKEAETKENRKKLLDKVFRVICMQAFKESYERLSLQLDNKLANDISRVQLTRTEFADALGLRNNSVFVRNMFLMVDKDKNGFISFHEFMDMFVILARGNAAEKARFLFNMNDFKGQGYLTREAFGKMIKSILDLSDSSLSDDQVNQLIDTLYSQAGLRDTDNINFDSFKKIFASDEYEQIFEHATLQLDGRAKSEQLSKSFSFRRQTFFDGISHDDHNTASPQATLSRRKSRVTIRTKQKEQPKTKWEKRKSACFHWMENFRLQIFWLTLYILVTIAIFVERAYYYSYEREDSGLRKIAGYGVTVTRGAASVMMWTYSSLLVTMCRNTITFLRETFFHRFIPFDSAHAMHKIIAFIALVFTVVHCIGHGINFYHISTHASVDMNCQFTEYFRATDVLASFHYWAWQTITGLTGIGLVLIVIIMYVFALPYARRHVFRAFWITHNLYVLLYVFMILHGLGRLVQDPIFYYYLLGPLVLFVLDKLVSVSRKKIPILVKKVELLPSDVTALTFKRPLNFEYKSGQWVRIACPKIGENEYHPFTLTSAPHEEHLSLHIRALGPWTTNLRKTYDLNNRGDKSHPMLYLDGPFGEGHQDWYRFRVSVLVGGGIGVTPFASILKDIAHKSKIGTKFPCEKVYFLWVTRTQKQFEWLMDIIQEVENEDKRNIVSTHIFITQFQQKYDLRTTMLYICERHFQKIAGRSLFTGLKATTHFGRPEFVDFLQSLHYEHPDVKQIGVFSCGPPPMTLTVEAACSEVKQYEGFPSYQHHFENF